MSQITGYKRNSVLAKTTTEPYLVSADIIDHKRNAALSVAIYGGCLSGRIDTVGTVIYTGDVAPGFRDSVSEPIWRICKIDTTSNPVLIGYAVKPATSFGPEEYAGFDHIWNNRASLTYR